MGDSRSGDGVLPGNAALIGMPAALAVRRSQLWRVWAIVAAVTAIAVTVVAQRTVNSGVVAVVVILWIAFACCVVIGLVATRRAKRLAADHLSRVLGFPFPPRHCFDTPDGWRKAIAREKQYHEQGYRPKFSITIGRPPRRP